MDDADDINVAFNIGSDGRIRGDHKNMNPYEPGSPQAYYFTLGWESVERSWGDWVEGRWKVKRLPPVEKQRKSDGSQHRNKRQGDASVVAVWSAAE